MKTCTSPLGSILLLAVATTAGAHATPVGISTSSFGGNFLDTCIGCSYILPAAFGTAGVMSTYTLHASGTGDITPLLLNGTDNGDGTTTFTISGIGTRQNDIGVFGNQTFQFGLTSGSEEVTATTYFGWADTNGPLVSFTYDAAAAGTFLFSGGNTIGAAYTLENTSQAFNLQNAFNGRTYDISASSIAVTPEPSSLLLLGTGMAGIAGLIRRRFAA